ncbi:MAG TPA: hypothetical protein DCE41_31515 [Cytophagales bacterium]|nr:hypothetical protein [Cytophagales bacterium]HAA18997.1 hypothetical protein [Cytophagales bacterium]HAP61826.1 hypothetical protein [Cytophagales bacterium]
MQDDPSLSPETDSATEQDSGSNALRQQTGRQALTNIREYLHHTLNIHEGTNIADSTSGIKKDIFFEGPRVWILICSIFIASIGLNTNSTAVIIGAMLISPLMGPILGIGLAVGTNDFKLLTKALNNFAIMVVISLATATIYFLITPLKELQDELLARTRPTVLDVAVALFGGLAGIIVGSRAEKNNVVPGVAIATALMPPLCTAGYGIATANWSFFLGAFYLFLLNSVIISVSTWAVVRYLRFPLVDYVSETTQKKYKRFIYMFVLIVIIPSAILFVQVIQESIFFNRAETFITEEFNYQDCEVVQSTIIYNDTIPLIEVFLMGEFIPAGEEARLVNAMKEDYGLEKAQLKLFQSGDASKAIERYSAQVSQETRNAIIEDIYRKNEELLLSKDSLIENKNAQIRVLEDEIIRYRGDSIPFRQVQRELQVHYPNLQKFAFSRVIESDLEGHTDTIPTAMVSWNRQVSRSSRTTQQAELRDWLEVRLNLDTLRVIGY